MIVEKNVPEVGYAEPFVDIPQVEHVEMIVEKNVPEVEYAEPFVATPQVELVAQGVFLPQLRQRR